MGLRSRRVVNQLLHRWRSALTSEERVQLMDYQHTETGPAEDEPFPQLNMAPDLDGCAGPLLECWSEGEMDFGSVSGKLLYRACVKVLNKKKLSGRVDTPWRSVLGFNGDIKPEWTHFPLTLTCSFPRSHSVHLLFHLPLYTDIITMYTSTNDIITTDIITNDIITDIITTDIITNDIITEIITTDIITNDISNNDIIATETIIATYTSTNDFITTDIITNDIITTDIITTDIITNDIIITYTSTNDIITTEHPSLLYIITNDKNHH
ncbi:hypothetical protein QTP86_008681 [Hemibagrus guttatus]|nr:hypothetical protein QTP86_008681 [Hemibagrus guttatus]